MALDFVKLDETTNPKELLNLLKKWDVDETVRYQNLHHEWEKNLLCFLGKQWLIPKSVLEGYTILEEDDEHYRPVSNHIARLVHLKRSQIAGKKIRGKVVPNSDTKSDIDSARLGNLALKAQNAIDKDEEVNQLVFMHAQLFGIGWKSTCKQVSPDDFLEAPKMETQKSEYFECPKCGHIDPEQSTCTQCGNMSMEYQSKLSEEMVLENGIPVTEKIPLYRISTSAVDPFRIKVSPGAVSSQIRWLTDSTVHPVSWLKSAFNVTGPGFYPENAQQIKKSAVFPRGVKLSESYKNSVTYVHSSVDRDVTKRNMADENNEELAVLHKSYFPPSKNWKMGRLITWTEHGVLYDEKPDLPNNKKLRRWHPYDPFIYFLHPLRLEGIPYIEELIPINKKINSVEAIIMEHLDRTASPDRYEFDNVQKNNDDASTGITRLDPIPGLPGGGIPGYLTHPAMASEVYKMREQYVTEIQIMGNMTEVQQGMHPAGVDTYRGLRLLQDAADSTESEMYERYYEYVRSSSQLKLAIMQECMITQDEDLLEMMRIIRTNEDYGEQEVKTFLGQDLRDNLNVVMEEADYLSESTGAQMDQVETMIAKGMITPEEMADPVTKIRILRKIGMGELPIPDKLDIEKAERIITLLETGQFRQIPPMLRFVDNKSLQLRVWSDWVKTSKFESLDPAIQNATMALIKKVQDELQAIEAAKIPPPGMQSEEGLPPPRRKPEMASAGAPIQ